MYSSSSCIYYSMFLVLCVISALLQASTASATDQCTAACGSGLSCCGAACYSPSYFVCQAGNTLCPVQGGVAWQACGLACYDPALYGCCNGAVIQIGQSCATSTPTSSPTASSTPAATTAPTVDAPTAASATDDASTQCTANCGAGLSCCGAGCYNPSQYACQNGNVLCPINSGTTWQACGTACYDPTSYSCCLGTIQAGTSCPGSAGSTPAATPAATPASTPASTPAATPASTPAATPPTASSSSITCADWTAYQPKPTRTLTFINQCDQDVWVGAEGTPMPQNGGWALPIGQSYSITLPEIFVGGRFWPRTGCSWTSNGKFVCQTGDCDGRFECNGKSGGTPSTLIEFTMAPDIDYYDLSLVDGYSIPLEVYPVSGQCQNVNNPFLGRFNCGRASVKMDTAQCPPELQISDAFNHTYCLSICAAVNMPSQRSKFQLLQNIYNNVDLRDKVCCACDCGDNCGCNSPVSKYCCSPYTSAPSEVGGKCYVESWPLPSPGNWPPRYDKVFKSQCPDAYSWQFDDFTATFQCRNADYVIKFCP